MKKKIMRALGSSRVTPRPRATASSIGATRHKYGAQRTEVDGISFASKREAARYGELKLLERAGEIRGLALQPPYALLVPMLKDPLEAFKHVGTYVADFVYYTKSGEKVVEDVKGFKTPLYRWKKKHVEAQYGITIREV